MGEGVKGSKGLNDADEDSHELADGLLAQR